MRGRGLERYAPLAGVVFFILVAVSFVLSNETPSVDDGTAEIIDYWKDNHTEEALSAIAASYAAFFLLWFAGSLRAAIHKAEQGAGRLAALSFAGAVVFATGLLVNNSIEFATAEAASDDAPPAVIETLSDLYNNFFLALGVGFALFMLASGLAVLRYGVLPGWLGWVAVVVGVLMLTPAWPAIFLGLIWILVTAIMLFRQQEAPAAPAAPAPPATGGGAAV